MPAFDLRGILIGKVDASETAGYATPISAGDAMTANLTVRRAEGRLYAESTLKEYLAKITGGTISLGVKYVKRPAQLVMFGLKEKTRQVGSTSVTSLLTDKTSTGNYVGVAFYAPDMIDGVEKFTAVFVYQAMFGQPDKTYQTMGENFNFQTPTTTGEFMGDKDGNFLETAEFDTEEEAIAWTYAVMGGTAPASGGES